MVITGIEVIRHNPGVAVGVVTGEKVSLTYGDTLRVNASLEYRGSAQTVTLYGAIGVRGVGFDEKVKGEAELELPDSPTEFSPVFGSVDILITADITPDTDYDIYMKLLEYPGAGRPEVDDVIDIVGIPPTYELLEETIYPYAYVYDGDAEVTTFTFKSEPFTPADWRAGRFASALEAEVEKAGGRVMELRVYADKTPLLWTNWRIELIATPLGEAVEAAPGIGVAVHPIVIILVAAIAIIGVILVTYYFIIKPLTYKHKPISPEIKAPMSRETLISLIGDFEVKLERTPTPPEELEEKSDEELRVYCDELAEAVVPPEAEVPWGLVAVAGVLGLGAVGVGAALAARRHKERHKE